MMCKRLALNFKNDIKSWGVFFLGLIAIFFISYFESDDLVDSFLSIIFLLAFMSATAVFYDILSLIFFRDKIGYYWIIFASVFIIITLPNYYLGILGLRNILGLLLMAFLISVVFLIFIWYVSKTNSDDS